MLLLWPKGLESEVFKMVMRIDRITNALSLLGDLQDECKAIGDSSTNVTQGVVLWHINQAKQALDRLYDQEKGADHGDKDPSLPVRE